MDTVSWLLVVGILVWGLIGAFVFLAKLAAGQNLSTNIPNFCLQIAVVTLMVFLFRVDKSKEESK